jgi:cytochrome c oxidase subunit 2
MWGAAILLMAGNSYAEYPLNLMEGVTTTSKTVYDLHMLIFWICVIACVATFAVLIYSIITHRKSKGAVPATFHESTTVEIIWTTIPFLVLVGMAVPATKALLALEDTRDADMSILVTGLQWKWKYEYLDGEAEGISFISTLDAKSNEIRQLGSGLDPADHEHYLLDVDNRVVVPINKKIRFLITADDVIHSWWVPDLGWKQDAVPGFVNDGWTELTEPGVYRGKCAELCGRDHGFMPIVLEAKTEEGYSQWVADQKAGAAAVAEAAKQIWTMDDLIAKGEDVYSKQCSSCHQPNGKGAGIFPAIAGSPIATGDIKGHMDVVYNGKGDIMPAFKGALNDVEMAAVITFQRNAFGNDVGDMVQPSEITTLR